MVKRSDQHHLLTVLQLSKQFDHHTALAPISFTAKQGEMITLCGGNGAGKSTLIKILAGLLPPSTGSVRIKGLYPSTDRKAYAQHIGYMPDDFHFSGLLTVREWLSFYGSLRRVPKVIITEKLKLVGLDSKQHTLCSNLSKGMRQRLLFAQACLTDPDILLLDEPTNGLDPFWIASFARMLRKMKQDQKTVIFSTHRIDLAVDLADILIFMHEGAVIQTWNREYDNNQTILKQLNRLIEKNLGSQS